MQRDEIDRRTKIIVDQYDGILPYHKVFYTLSIKENCSNALTAFKKFDNYLSNQEDEYAVSALQAALIYSSAISRYFWPSRTKNGLAKERGKQLRLALGVAAESPLSNRSLRNALEHFDERLDDYLVKLDAGYIFPTSIVGDHTLADEQPGHFFRLVDPVACCFVIFNQKYWYAEIREELDSLMTKFEPDSSL